jgi:hypothetical protein
MNIKTAAVTIDPGARGCMSRAPLFARMPMGLAKTKRTALYRLRKEIYGDFDGGQSKTSDCQSTSSASCGGKEEYASIEMWKIVHLFTCESSTNTEFSHWRIRRNFVAVCSAV